MKIITTILAVVILATISSCGDKSTVAAGDNSLPILYDISDTTVVSGNTLVIQAIAVDEDDDPLTYLLVIHKNQDQPTNPDIEFSETTGLFRFNTTELDAPSRYFDIMVFDDRGGIDSTSFKVSVDVPFTTGLNVSLLNCIQVEVNLVVDGENLGVVSEGGTNFIPLEAGAYNIYAYGTSMSSDDTYCWELSNYIIGAIEATDLVLDCEGNECEPVTGINVSTTNCFEFSIYFYIDEEFQCSLASSESHFIPVPPGTYDIYAYGNASMGGYYNCWQKPEFTVNTSEVTELLLDCDGNICPVQYVR